VRTVVTGGAGFVGSHVVDALLARGDEVVVVDSLVKGKRENVAAAASLRVQDVREPLEELFDEVRPEAVFHLAAQADVRVSVERPVEDAEVNVLGTIRVLEAASRHRAQVVFSSTGGAIYGECEEPARESSELRPVSPYGMAKLAAEEYLRGYNRLQGSTHVVLRYGNVFGPRQDPHGEAGVVAIFAERILRTEPVTVFGDGEQTRDFVFVDDVVDAFVRAATRGGGLVCNIGTGRETSVNDLFSTMTAQAGVKAKPVFAPIRTGELLRSSLDVERASIQLGWRPWTDLADGTRAVLDFVGSRLD